MAFPKFEKEVKNISGLPDVPAIPAYQLKALFDKGPEDLRKFLDETLVPELERADEENVKSEPGKGLSENDYTTEEKQKVSENTAARHMHENKALLDAIKQQEWETILTILSQWNSGTILQESDLVEGTNIVIKVLENGKVQISSVGDGSGGVSKTYVDQVVSERALNTEVLLKGNDEPWTPSADYNPATKKYADDVAGSRMGKVTGADGNIPVFNADGSVKSSGKKPDDFVSSSAFSSHVGDSDIHVTMSQKNAWTKKAEKAEIVEHGSDNAVSIIIDSVSKIHKAGTIPSLQLIVFSGSDYSLEPTVYSISFVSGATATTFTAPENFVFSGDGCDEGVFVPEASTSYEMIGMWNFDTLRWVVKAW